MLASVDGVLGPVADARIPVTDPGFVRGDGVFEVVRLYGGRPFALEDHYARMERSARTARIEIDFAALRAEVEALLAAEDPGDAALRIMCTGGGRRIALIERIPPYPDAVVLVPVTYAPTRILDGVKSLSYCANMLAGRLAAAGGGHDALLVTPHGRVLEAPTSSFFWVAGGRLFTPPLDDHILDSITRRRILQHCEVEERSATLDDVRGADEAFLASTFKEALPVRAVAGVTDFGEPPGPVTRDVGTTLSTRIAEELAAA